MPDRTIDIAIVGAGLSGGLIALALHRVRPELSVRLVESGDAPGGNHRWSWFASDLGEAGAALMDTFPQARWDAGYDVRFPGYSRTLATPYRSLSSADFAATLERELPEGSIVTGADAVEVSGGGVRLADGTAIMARCVLDARGVEEAEELSGGWQVFLGRHLRTAQPHGLTRPTIMDASVEQLGGYRFVYVLPLSEDEVFVEDTYYQDTPVLDRAALGERIEDYVRAQDWGGGNVELLHEETGVLPVVTGGDVAHFLDARQVASVGLVGARGGFVHPLTSYTLPFAVETALWVADHADLPGPELARRLRERSERHWRRTGFYRLLGSMLFGASEPRERYRVFARFYGLREGLIERFYAARSTLADKARVLAGKPPVRLGAAIGALRTNRPPLVADKENTR